MQTSPWERIIWIMSFLADASLLCAVFRGALWRKAPIFTSFVTFQVVRATTLFVVSHYGSNHSYFWTFWDCAVLDYILQLGLVVEIGGAILRSPEKQATKMWKEVVGWSLVASLLAAMVSFLCSPSPATMLDEWDTRVSLFTSLLTGWSYLVLSHLSNKRRICRSRHILIIGNGLVIWTLASLARDGVYTATRWVTDLPKLDGMLMSIYVGVTIYWTVAMWRMDGHAEQRSSTRSGRQASVNIDEHAKRAS